jgi:hypothetical protein
LPEPYRKALGRKLASNGFQAETLYETKLFNNHELMNPWQIDSNDEIT